MKYYEMVKITECIICFQFGLKVQDNIFSYIYTMEKLGKTATVLLFPTSSVLYKSEIISPKF